MSLPLVKLEHNGHTLTFDPNPRKHIYTLDGLIVPGVTTVNKKGYPTSEKLLNWFMKNGRNSKQIASEAADVGKTLHKYAELRIEAGKPITDFEIPEGFDEEQEEAIQNTIELFEKWISSNTTRTIGSEMMVASPTYQFAGTLDRLASNVHDEAGIEDYKTSSGFFVDQFVQMAGYKIALYEWKGIEAKWFRINLFGKKDANFHTLVVNREGWFLDDKLFETDSYAMQKLESQFLRNRKTFAFVAEHDDKFDVIYNQLKVDK